MESTDFTLPSGSIHPEVPLIVPDGLSFEAVKNLVAAKSLRFADFWFTELSGRPWRITIPSDAVTETLFSQGLPLDGQPVGGSWNGVFFLRPSPDSCYPDPATSAPTLAMFCDVLDPATRQSIPLEPRHVLRAAKKLVENRLDATVTIGVEPEFFLLDARGRTAGEAAVWDFLRQFGLALGEAGIRVDFFRTGPAIGQGRVQMRAGDALQLADRVMLYRQVAANLARSRGLTAVFLPHPVAGPASAGMPVHQALWKDGQNIFHDDSGWALTSALCRWYAGGLIEHLPALLAFCAPSCNSYRRLIAGQSGPWQTLLSTTQRQAVCRIPARSTAPAARRIKFCAPDATANPYLALAAIMMAGLDGIEREIEPALDGQRPAARQHLPHCLEAALEALDDDRAFLTNGRVFSDALIDAWIANRWEQQVLPVRQAPHPEELALGNPAASALIDPGAWSAQAGLPLN